MPFNIPTEGPATVTGLSQPPRRPQFNAPAAQPAHLEGHGDLVSQVNNGKENGNYYSMKRLGSRGHGDLVSK